MIKMVPRAAARNGHGQKKRKKEAESKARITREIKSASSPTMRGHSSCISKATADYAM
jgi:hypothetical protein